VLHAGICAGAVESSTAQTRGDNTVIAESDSSARLPCGACFWRASPPCFAHERERLSEVRWSEAVPGFSRLLRMHQPGNDQFGALWGPRQPGTSTDLRPV
jgi:hypothetical protein